MCGQTLLCKAQIEAIIWKVMEEGRGCHATGYQEGGYAHKPAKRAPAPDTVWFHSSNGRTAEEEKLSDRNREMEGSEREQITVLCSFSPKM